MTRFLLLTSVLPYPPKQGSDVFQLEAARALLELGPVRWIARRVGEQRDTEMKLRGEGFELSLDNTFRARDPISRIVRRARLQWGTWRRKEPRVLGYTVTPGYMSLVDQALREWPDAIVVGAYWFVGRAVAKGSPGRRVLVIADVDHHREAEAMGRRVDEKLTPELEAIRAAELEAFASCDRLLCLTPVDVDLARGALARAGIEDGPSIGLWPASIHVPATRLPLAARRTGDPLRLLCYGHWKSNFNRDGLRRFLKEIWPTLRQEMNSSPTLSVAGRDLGTGLIEMISEQEGEYLGWVEDLPSTLAKCDAVIVPLDYAGGLRYRMLEAMSLGRPVICTSVAARGSQAVAGRQYLEANATADWRRALEELDNPARADSLAEEAYDFVSERYGEKTRAARLRAAFLDELAE